MKFVCTFYNSALAVTCDFMSDPDPTPEELLFRLIETADNPRQMVVAAPSVASAVLTPVVLAFCVEYKVTVGSALIATGKHQVPDEA